MGDDFLATFSFLAGMLFCFMCFVTSCVYQEVAGALVFGFLFLCGLLYMFLSEAFN